MVNLRNTRGNIIKVRSRDRTGRIIHKSEFSTDDKKSIDRELRVWKDKLGVSLNSFKKIVDEPFDRDELYNIKKFIIDKNISN